ncbi:MAG: GTPase HflX [Firmicutes bacterium]|nr:GTPase HflX [Bacillota bacterium]
MIRFNENNEIIRDEEYNAIIVGLQWKGDISRSMDELEGLCEADGITVAGRVEQSLKKPDNATLIGSGKVLELAELVENMDIDTVVFNDELSGAQIRNLENALGVRVIDRTILILDIFADRATSPEGKLQVELAQLQYRMPRLTGFGKSLSRLGGGIGTRGPGENKLETDRRHISARIDDIRAELKKISKNREVQKTERDRSGIPVVALMGYTNSGKSAIMNALLAMSSEFQGTVESKEVDSKDMLFATLDAQHRKITLGKGKDFVLIDTVGFVSGLPHGLVEAFKSTLEEVRDADLLIHVVDTSYENRDFQIEVTEKVIGQLTDKKTPTIMAYNKMDLVDESPIDATGNEAVYISAKTGQGMDELADRICEHIFGGMEAKTLLIPYDKGSITSYLCEKGQIEEMTYEETGTRLRGRFKREDLERYRNYEVTD